MPKCENALSIGPAPVQIELEFTNYCNASCIACPRSQMPTYGFMEMTTLSSILERYQNYTNPLTGEMVNVIVAGGGDPLMHPAADKMLAEISRRGFKVTLITNAIRLDCFQIPNILKSVDELLVSFWEINPSAYRLAMRLDYERALSNVLEAKSMAPDRNTRLAVQWLQTEHTVSTAGEIQEFWRKLGISDVRGGNVSWNRAQDAVNDDLLDASEALKPDFSKDVWCADLYLADCFGWRGDARLCCCSYFQSDSLPVVDNHVPSIDEIRQKKRKIFVDRSRSECHECRLPRRLRARQILGKHAEGIAPKILSDLEY